MRLYVREFTIDFHDSLPYNRAGHLHRLRVHLVPEDDPNYEQDYATLILSVLNVLWLNFCILDAYVYLYQVAKLFSAPVANAKNAAADETESSVTTGSPLEVSRLRRVVKKQRRAASEGSEQREKVVANENETSSQPICAVTRLHGFEENS